MKKIESNDISVKMWTSIISTETLDKNDEKELRKKSKKIKELVEEIEQDEIHEIGKSIVKSFFLHELKDETTCSEYFRELENMCKEK